MSGNPVSIQHQGYARLLSENTLQGTGTHRTSGRQAQTLQAYRTSMREDDAELRLVRRARSRLHLDQIRPHGLDRVRNRIESVLDWATVRGHRQGDNPARWKGHLSEVLAAPSKIAKPQNLAA